MGSGSSTLSENDVSSMNVNHSFNFTKYDVNNTTGDKRALLIGCNYTGTGNQLDGCINDVNLIKSLIQPWGFNVTMMTDNSKGNLYPNKNNINFQLLDFIKNKTKPGDTLLIYYSGHGSLVTDSIGGDEGNFAQDSAIVPLNFTSRSDFILDDTIRSYLVQAEENANIFLCFDSCNSGSVCDLRYLCFDASYRDFPGNKNSEIITRTISKINDKYLDTKANIVSLSGCKDTQTSKELRINGTPHGALTYSIYATLGSLTPDIKFSKFLQTIKNTIMYNIGIYDQTPVLMYGNSSFDKEQNVNTFLKI